MISDCTSPHSGVPPKLARKNLLEQLSVALWLINARMVLWYWELSGLILMAIPFSLSCIPPLIVIIVVVVVVAAAAAAAAASSSKQQQAAASSSKQQQAAASSSSSSRSRDNSESLLSQLALITSDLFVIDSEVDLKLN